MNAAVRISTPVLPYWGNIPGSIAPGKAISIKGVFPPVLDPSVYSEINLCENSKELVALHISIRFNHREVIRNSCKNGQWKNEEKGGPFPFELGSEFWVQIAVQQDAYHISVNGQECWTFRHRMPFFSVNSLNIDGPFQIYQVEHVDQNAMYQPGSVQPAMPFLPPVYNPPVPFTQMVTGGIKPGMMFYISGLPLPSFKSFSVNFQCGCAAYPPPDIAFHFDVRAFNGTLVRNTRLSGNWMQEEVDSALFPFQPTVPFDMMILVQNEKYMVAVNGQHLVEYNHRIRQFSMINALSIEKDINVTSIRFGR